MNASNPRIKELDGLRAFAVLAVVLYHITYYAGSIPLGSHWLMRIVECLGHTGVSVFFVISGYIITCLLLREKATARVSLRAFYVRRFFRIVPPFAVYLLVLLFCIKGGHILMPLRNIGMSACFFGNLGVFVHPDWFVVHTWSLSVEEQYYLLFPALFCLVMRFRVRPTALVLCTFYFACVFSPQLSHAIAKHIEILRFFISDLANFRYIITGVLLALYARRILPLLTGKSWLLPLGLLSFTLATGLGLLDFRLHAVPETIHMLEPAACGLFVMWFVQNPAKCAMLRWSAVQWLGTCSYSIYLWQQLFTGPGNLYRGWSPAFSSVALVAILLCAALSYYFIERPGIRLGRWVNRQLANPDADSLFPVADGLAIPGGKTS